MNLRKLSRLTIIFTLIAVLLGGVSPQPAQAQDSVISQVVGLVMRNIGINPAPTKGQLDSGNVNLPFEIAYEFNGLDLREESLSCTAPILGDDEIVIGRIGWRVLVTVSGRRYEFRTDAGGGNIIRCINRSEAGTSFGAATATGATLSGDAVSDRALAHLQGYLGSEFELSVANAEEPPVEDYPRVFYRWSTTIFDNSALECPASGGTFTEGDVAGFFVTLTVDGRVYRYRANADGSVLVLCISGRADPASIGVNFPAQTES